MDGSEVGQPGNGTSVGSESIDGGNTHSRTGGNANTPGGTETERDIYRIIADANTAADAERAEEEARRPRVTAPPPVDDEGTGKRGRPKGSKNTAKADKADAAACGVVIGAIFGGFSLAVCGNLSLGLSPESEKVLGEDIAACLDTLPTAKYTKYVKVSSPWVRLGGHLGGELWLRYNMIKAAIDQQRQEATERPPQHTATNGVHNSPFVQDGMVVAPDPNKVRVS